MKHPLAHITLVLPLLAANLAYAASPASTNQDSALSSQPQAGQQSSPTPQEASPETKKPKKVWTNDDVTGANGAVSVVGDPKNKPRAAAAKPANAQYVASVRKQLEKLQKQIDEVNKQLVDLKNFSEGDSSNNASGIKLGKHYNREPIEAQMQALQDKKKSLQVQIDALLDEARKKGVEPGQLR